MRKIALILFFAAGSLVLSSCGGESNTTEDIDPQVQKEIQSLDSLQTELDNESNVLKEKTKSTESEVEDLLKDI